MMGEGLAAQAGGQMGGSSGPTVEEIIGLLMEGVSPDDLLAQGVPMTLIEQAIKVIMAEQGAGEPQIPATQSGLAATAAVGY